MHYLLDLPLPPEPATTAAGSMLPVEVECLGIEPRSTETRPHSVYLQVVTAAESQAAFARTFALVRRSASKRRDFKNRIHGRCNRHIEHFSQVGLDTGATV